MFVYASSLNVSCILMWRCFLVDGFYSVGTAQDDMSMLEVPLNSVDPSCSVVLAKVLLSCNVMLCKMS